MKFYALRFLALMPLGFALATPFSYAEDTDASIPFEIDAEELNFTGNTGVIEASGKVTLTGKDGVLIADRITYDPETQKVFATGNVLLTDPDGREISVDTLELSGDFKTGALTSINMNVPGLGDEGIPVLSATKATKLDETTYSMEDVVYSPCKTCGDSGRRPWEIHASKVTYDTADGWAEYQHARLNAFGVPVLYLPYLAHPIGKKQAKTGLLMPKFGTSTALGLNATVAGYINSPAENADYTLRTRAMSDRGVQFMAERRQVGLTFDNEIRASYLNDTGTGEPRGHAMVKGLKTFNEGTRLGLNSEIASDDTYLTEYFNRNEPYLRSTLFLENGGLSHYAAIQGSLYQDLDATADDGSTAQILPQIEFLKWFNRDDGQEFSLHFDTLNLQRGVGVNSRRITTGADYKIPWLLDDGSLLEATASLRLDIYNVEGLTGVNQQYNGNSGRFLPETTLSWEKPYLSPSGYHTIAPKIMLAMSPRGGNPTGIPNEDSVAYELDANNLFEPSRFAGRDRVESGPRGMWGLDNRWGYAGTTDWRLFIGQSYRRFDDVALPESGGASANVSDWVGYMEANPTNWFKLSQRFRLDHANFSTRRMDTSFMLGREDIGFARATYSYLTDGPEDLYAEAEYPFNDSVRFISHMRRDLVDDRLLSGEAGLRFSADCYELEVVARRRGYTNGGDLQPSTDYLVNLELLTFGSQ